MGAAGCILALMERGILPIAYKGKAFIYNLDMRQ